MADDVSVVQDQYTTKLQANEMRENQVSEYIHRGRNITIYFQIFNIASTPITSVKNPKSRSGTGVNNRKDIKVVGQLPKLVAELQTHDTHGITDIVCCEMELCSTNGPVTMTSMYPVSQSHGMVNFDRKKNEEKKSFNNIISTSISSPRLTCLILSLMCRPCSKIQCRKNGLLRYSNTPGQQVDMCLTNMAKDLDMVRLKQLPVNVIIPGGGRLDFSTVIASGAACQTAHCPPLTDFDKSYLTQYLGSRGDYHQVLGHGQDLYEVKWRCGVTSPAMGQNIVTVDDGQVEVGELKVEGVLLEKQEARVNGNTGIWNLVDVGNIIFSFRWFSLARNWGSEQAVCHAP